MPFGPRQGWSDYLRGRHVREMREATVYAACIGKPLLYRLHITWNRTSIEDDVTGQVFAQYRHRAARWLRDRGVGFYAIGVRERPPGPTPRPNAHMHLHIPVSLLADFKAAAVGFLPPGVAALDHKAILVDEIHPTDRAQQGALDYICKGVTRKAGALLGIRATNQGRIYGKRHFVSESLGAATRQRQTGETALIGTEAVMRPEPRAA